MGAGGEGERGQGGLIESGPVIGLPRGPLTTITRATFLSRLANGTIKYRIMPLGD